MFITTLIISAILSSFYAVFIIIIHLNRKRTQKREFAKVDSESGLYINICVIVPVRNEVKNVKKCIRSLLDLSYPKENTKVIFVNDHSTDETTEIISQFKNDGIELLHLPEYVEGKKSAIMYSLDRIPDEIEYLLFTDGDCTLSPDVLAIFNNIIQVQNPVAIAGPVAYECNNGSLLCGFQQMDMMGNMAVTQWGIDKRRFFLGNGANLFVNKRIFIELNPYKDNMIIPSGDDVFLMKRLYEEYPKSVVFASAAEAMSTTIALSSWKELLQQRLRWAGKSKAYANRGILTIQGGVFLLSVMFVVCLILGICVDPKNLYPALMLLMSKILVDFVLLKNMYRDYRVSINWLYYPILQLIYYVYILLSGIVAVIPLSYNWKSRLHQGRVKT